jgi:hypothetical protein
MTGKTITIDQSEMTRILAALRSVTTDLRDLIDNGFPKPPRKNCNADAGSAYENWWDDKRVCLQQADEVLADTEHLG